MGQALRPRQGAVDLKSYLLVWTPPQGTRAHCQEGLPRPSRPQLPLCLDSTHTWGLAFRSPAEILAQRPAWARGSC